MRDELVGQFVPGAHGEDEKTHPVPAVFVRSTPATALPGTQCHLIPSAIENRSVLLSQQRLFPNRLSGAVLASVDWSVFGVGRVSCSKALSAKPPDHLDVRTPGDFATPSWTGGLSPHPPTSESSYALLFASR